MKEERKGQSLFSYSRHKMQPIPEKTKEQNENRVKMRDLNGERNRL